MKDRIINTVLSGAVAVACSVGYMAMQDTVNRDGAVEVRDGDGATNLVIENSKQFSKIKFNEQVPLVQMVDTNGNFYLPCGTYGGNTNSLLMYNMMTVCTNRFGETTIRVSNEKFVLNGTCFEQIN